MSRWLHSAKRFGIGLVCGVMLVSGIHVVDAISQPTSVQAQLAQSIGARYIQAKMLAKKGQLKQAVTMLEKMLKEVEDGPAAVPIRRKLSELYLKLQKTEHARKTLRVGSGPASRPLAKSYHKKFSQYLHIHLKMKLAKKVRGSKQVQERKYRFVLSRQKKVTRNFVMNAGPSKVNAVLQYEPGKGLKLHGTLQAGNKSRLIRIDMPKFGTSTGNERRNVKVRQQIDNTSLAVKLQVALTDKLGRGPSWNATGTPPPPRPSARKRRVSRFRFAMRFRNAKLAKVLKHLADMNGLKISYNGDLGSSRVVNLKIKAKLRKNLLAVACAKLGLTCTVKGDMLRIAMNDNKGATTPAPPKPPKASKGTSLPKAPTPPIPPRR